MKSTNGSMTPLTMAFIRLDSPRIRRPDELGAKNLFAALDRIEDRLSTRSYLVQDTFTEADIRLFTTIVRFDPVYYGHFKCNLQVQFIPNDADF